MAMKPITTSGLGSHHGNNPGLFSANTAKGHIGRLPTELLDMIFQHLKVDKWTLSQIALVCHLWHITVLRYLFNSLLLIMDRRMVFVEDRHRLIQSFLDFLNNNPQLGTSIQNLRLIMTNPINSRKRDINISLIRIETLDGILRRLEHLKMLELSILHYRCSSAWSASRASSSNSPRSRLKRLALNEIERPEYLPMLLDLFEEVDHLELGPIWQVDHRTLPEEKNQNQSIHLLRVASLSITGCSGGTVADFLGVLERLLDPLTLKVLQLVALDPESVQTLNRFLRTGGRHLHEFSYSLIHSLAEEKEQKIKVDLSPCAVLRSVYFTFYVNTSDSLEHKWRHSMMILEGALPSLRRIHIIVDFNTRAMGVQDGEPDAVIAFKFLHKVTLGDVDRIARNCPFLELLEITLNKNHRRLDESVVKTIRDAAHERLSDRSKYLVNIL